MIQTTNKSQMELFDAGVYTARCKGVTVEQKQPDTYHDQPYQQLRWSWELKIPGRTERPKYSTWTSLSLNSKSHLPGLLAALGVPVVKGADGTEGFDETAVEGKVCQLVIEAKPGNDGQTRNRTTVYVRKNGQAPAPASAPAAAPEPPPADDDDFADDPEDSEPF